MHGTIAIESRAHAELSSALSPKFNLFFPPQVIFTNNYNYKSNNSKEIKCNLTA